MGYDEAIVMLGAFAGGFIGGLTGFGQALVALPIWLFALPPAIAAPLAIAGGVAGQLTTLPSQWRYIDWRRAARYVVPGLVGVPLGAYLLARIDVAVFKLAVGLLIVGYCLFMLLARPSWRLSERRLVDGLVGFGGGVLSGLAGLAGPLPIIWTSLIGLPRETRRALYQVFILVMQAAALVAVALTGLIGGAALWAILLSVPTTMIASHLGRRLYDRLHARHFEAIVLAVLTASGMALIVAGLPSLLEPSPSPPTP